MSEIVTVDNPFGEARQMSEQAYMFDPYRRAAASILGHMELCPEDIVEERYDKRTRTAHRALSLICTAPYNQRLDTYLNPLATPEELRAEDRITLNAVLSAGVAIPDNGTPSYWARIRRQDGRQFGLTGMSPRDRSGKIERWHGLLATIGLKKGEPVVELWGERPEYKPLARPRHLLVRMGAEEARAAKLQHCQTIYTIFDRKQIYRGDKKE